MERATNSHASRDARRNASATNSNPFQNSTTSGENNDSVTDSSKRSSPLFQGTAVMRATNRAKTTFPQNALPARSASNRSPACWQASSFSNEKTESPEVQASLCQSAFWQLVPDHRPMAKTTTTRCPVKCMGSSSLTRTGVAPCSG